MSLDVARAAIDGYLRLLGDTTHGTYYVVRAFQAGLLAPASNRVATFAYRLSAGN